MISVDKFCYPSRFAFPTFKKKNLNINFRKQAKCSHLLKCLFNEGMSHVYCPVNDHQGFLKRIGPNTFTSL